MKTQFLLITVLIGAMLMSTCKKDSSSDITDDIDDTENVEPLNWLEEEIAHKWSRYHAYDGSYMYYIFFSDRTACYFEITSSGSRTDNKCYTNWSIDESQTTTINGETAYAIYIEGSGLTNYYSYIYNIIYKGGYDNLGMSSSSTTKDCECDF